PGVKVGTVTNVLEDMMRLRERRRAYPGHPLPAHLGQIAGMPGRLLDQPAHAMAPNTTTDDVPFQGACRAVMRTAGAVVGLARQKRLIVPRAYGLQDRQASRNTWCLARLRRRGNRGVGRARFRAKPVPRVCDGGGAPA